MAALLHHPTQRKAFRKAAHASALSFELQNVRKGMARICPHLDANAVLKNDWLLMEDVAEAVDELLDRSATPCKKIKAMQSNLPSLYELFLFNHALPLEV